MSNDIQTTHTIDPKVKTPHTLRLNDKVQLSVTAKLCNFENRIDICYALL